MAEKHTPGPWEADPHEQDQRNDTAGYWTIEAPMVGRFGVVADTLNRDHVIDPDEDRANAKLIAAAPDLLEACKLAQAFGSTGDTHEGLSVSEFLRAAIAKAEGLTPP